MVLAKINIQNSVIVIISFSGDVLLLSFLKLGFDLGTRV